MSRVPDELRNRFLDRQDAQMAPKLRAGLLIAAGLFPLFLVFDLYVAPQPLNRSLPIRLAISLGYLSLHAISRLRQSASWTVALLYSGIVIGAGGVTLLSQTMNHGEVLAVGSLMLMVVVITALVNTVRLAASGYLLLLVTANAFAVALDASRLHFFAVNMFTLSASAVGVALAFVSERLSLRAFELELALERMATLDSLSGARTRGSFIELAQAEIARSGRTGAPLSLLLLDIDRFKSINDTWGHPAGDAVIRSLADTARSVLRSSDVLGRIGGEEFAILLPGSDTRTAHAVAERLRLAVAGVPADIGGHTIRYTVSMGVATLDGSAEALDRLMSRADEALYAAKHGGRNQVRLALVA